MRWVEVSDDCQAPGGGSWGSRRRWRACSAGGILGRSLWIAVWLVNKDNFTAVTEFNGMVKPAPTVLLPTHDVGEIEDVATALKGRVDALAARVAASADG